MPRCISSTSPDDRSASRYLARRPSPVTVRPCSRSAKSFGKGQRKSPRLAATSTKRAPSITGASPRRTVSTSGSSGTKAPFARIDVNLRRSFPRKRESSFFALGPRFRGDERHQGFETYSRRSGSCRRLRIGSPNTMRLLNGSTTATSIMPQSCRCRPGRLCRYCLSISSRCSSATPCM